MDNSVLNHLRYIRIPRFSVRAGLSLGRVLLTLTPEDPGPGVLSASGALRARIDELEAQWKVKQEPDAVDDPRAYDIRLDRAWAAIEAGLARFSLVASESVDRQRAMQIHAWLFPNGLTFTQLPYMEQHAECERLVDLIEEKGLREDIGRLVGEMFVQEMLDAHDAYGEALGITHEGRDKPPSVSLEPPLRALSRAISVYALQVLGFAELDPPKNMAAARRALEPIERLRRVKAQRKRRGIARGEAIDDHEVDDEEDLFDDVTMAS